jgi:hypothetical protein
MRIAALLSGHVLLLLLVGMQALAQTPSAAVPSQPGSNPNVLSPAEERDGWRLLFDGRSMENWRSFRNDSVIADRWVIEDHCLYLYPRGGDRRIGGDLVTRERFGNFEFAAEWKAGPGVNSGIKYLIDEFFAPERGPVAFEYQIMVERDTINPNRQPVHSTGALYDMIPPQGGVLRPAGSFNESRIVVKGAQVEHWLNGEKLLSFDRESPAFRELVAKSKFARWAGFGLNEHGHISLQDHGNEIWFRRVRVRQLAAPDTDVALPSASQE